LKILLGVNPMEAHDKYRLLVACLLAAILSVSGCFEQAGGKRTPGGAISPGPDDTIGSVAEVFSLEAIPVEGYGVVGGLSGTGSAECPAELRKYLKQYILKQLAKDQIDVEEFLNSRDTAVVYLSGLMPTTGSKNDYFDLKVTALKGTQTSSLEGGWLYGAELKARGTFGLSSRTLALAQGPVYIDTIDPPADKTTGYILAGGTVLDEYNITIVLRRPDFATANLIRNRLIERFGSGIANAVNRSLVQLKAPDQYKRQKKRFILIVRSLYLYENSQAVKERVEFQANKLASLKDVETAEAALETIGGASLPWLVPLLSSPNEEVRFRAARCMLNIGDDRALDTLRAIALDVNSTRRKEALDAIATAARRNDAIAVSERLLNDDDFDIRLAAYEHLRELKDIAITQEFIARDFFLEQIARTQRKSIFVARSGQPRIVLFGAPLWLHDNIFIQYRDITINAPAGNDYVTIIFRNPKKPTARPIQVKCSFEVADLIRTLCEEPPSDRRERRSGLGVSYANMIALLKEMCDKGALQSVTAEDFRAGPLPKIDPIVKR